MVRLDEFPSVSLISQLNLWTVVLMIYFYSSSYVSFGTDQLSIFDWQRLEEILWRSIFCRISSFFSRQDFPSSFFASQSQMTTENCALLPILPVLPRNCLNYRKPLGSLATTKQTPPFSSISVEDGKSKPLPWVPLMMNTGYLSVCFRMNTIKEPFDSAKDLDQSASTVMPAH